MVWAGASRPDDGWSAAGSSNVMCPLEGPVTVVRQQPRYRLGVSIGADAWGPSHYVPIRQTTAKAFVYKLGARVQVHQASTETDWRCPPIAR